MFELLLYLLGRYPVIFSFHPSLDHSMWSPRQYGDAEILKLTGGLSPSQPSAGRARTLGLLEAGRGCPAWLPFWWSRSACPELSSAHCRASLRLDNDQLNYSFSKPNELCGDTFVVQSKRYKRRWSLYPEGSSSRSHPLVSPCHPKEMWPMWSPKSWWLFSALRW